MHPLPDAIVGAGLPKTPGFTPGQARCDEARMLLNLTHIGQIALPVADVDRSEAFYRNVLGLPKQYRFGDLTFFDCAGVRLLLEKSERSITPQGCIYFRCADIALTVGELTRRGLRLVRGRARAVRPAPVARLGSC